MGKIKKLIWTYDGIESFEGIIRYIAEDSKYYARHKLFRSWAESCPNTIILTYGN